MENIRKHLYLAALLHDIGKFYQRADKNLLEDKNELSDYSKNLANDICPVNDNGRFGYQHVIWTNEFLEKVKTCVEKIPGLKVNSWTNNGEDTLPNLACNHHSPKTELQALVSLADWWSAGIDRYNPVNENQNNTTTEIFKGKKRYKQIPLYSIFNRINEGNFQSAFPLQFLSIAENACIPKEIKEVSDGITEKSYNDLWNDFLTEFENLPTDSFNGFAESLLYLLKKYTWCIPSNTMDMSNVSLYEHLKTTAAFADCLYLYKKENPKDFTYNTVTNRLILNNGVCPVLLLGGDLSGIQKFIYNIASRKAAVSLKGRSFYLQLLIDSVIQRIISHPYIDVNTGNVVYSSGGKFYMLLPNTEKIRQALDYLKKEFEQELWKEHHGQLLLNLDYVSFAYLTNSKELYFEKETGKTIGDLWKCLADKLTSVKNQKFKSVLIQDFNKLFLPEKFDKDVKVCSVTGIESKDCVRIDSKDAESPFVLPIVKVQVELGIDLKRANYILTQLAPNNYLNNRENKVEICGIVNHVLPKLADLNITSADIVRSKKINNTEFLTKQISGKKVSYGFQFYGGNEQALKNNSEMKAFEDLANGTYLGILRMDVDSLGNIFIKGLPEEARSFAAYSTLSFLLDYFFSGYLNTIRNEFNNDVNILYSGGDDVFAIGRWDKLIEFAHKIRIEFERFVGRPDISISGGIVMVGEKFPIAKAAELAGKAEDLAKDFNNKSKNAFNLLGESISWKDEYDYVFNWKNKLKNKCQSENMPRSILHKIMALADLKRKDEMKYVWHTVYFLKRFSDGKSNAIKQFCKDIEKEVIIDNNSSRNYDLMAIAARWAELELKEFE